MTSQRLLNLLIIITIGCSPKSPCDESKIYYNSFGNPNRELSNPSTQDRPYMNTVEFAQRFVRDSLNEELKCFQYNFSAAVIDEKVFGIVQLYDKRLEISEKSPFNDTIYYRLNHIRDLYFDSTGVYRYNMWIADTDEEQAEFDSLILRRFQSNP